MTRTLTGSPSKGRTGYYYYYHCKLPCKVKFSAKVIHKDFEDSLNNFVPYPGMAELFKEVITDAVFDDKQSFDQERKRIISEISDQHNRLTKMRSMLLSDDIDLEDYKIMKSKCDIQISSLEVELKELKQHASETSNMEQIIDAAVNRLQILSDLYSEGNIPEKRYVIGSIYGEK